MIQRSIIFTIFILSSGLCAMEKTAITFDELKQYQNTIVGTTNDVAEIPPQIKSDILNDMQDIESDSIQTRKNFLHNLIQYLENPESFERRGVTPAKGILLLSEIPPRLRHYKNNNDDTK